MKKNSVVICDVYRTLLNVFPAPRNAETVWRELGEEVFGKPLGCSLEEFSLKCESVIKEDHQTARVAGIAYPEVDWSSVIARVLPEGQKLTQGVLADFVFRHMQLLRTLELMPGAVEFLNECLQQSIPLGIASNAQAYTLRELGEALAGEGLSLAVFAKDLTFWSFEHGFSKPDPHVFRLLAARLACRGVETSRALMVGDREDNDIRPAFAQGFRTWKLSSAEDTNWQALFRDCFH